LLENGWDYDAWWCAAEAIEKLTQADGTDLKKRSLTGEQWDNLEYCLDKLDQRPAVIGVLRLATFENTASVIVPRCREALESTDRKLVQNSVWILERLRVADNETLGALSTLYSHAKDLSQSMRPRIVEAFGQIAAPATRELLEHEVKNAVYFRTRAYAAMGLGRIGDIRSVAPLRQALHQEEESSVVPHIADALYAILDPRIRAIQQVARDSRWPENGMIADESNYWYGAPEVYDAFANAEDPQGVSLDYALRLVPEGADVVLELGIGTGRLTFHAMRTRPDIKSWVGIDASPAMCEFTQAKSRFVPGVADRLTVHHALSESLPLPDESVDIVISAWAFPSRTWDQDRAVAELREVRRVLRPNGKLLTIGWDEHFRDELSELWYRFVPEPDFRRERLDEWRARRRARLSSTRNCSLTFILRNLKVPLLFATPEEAARTIGFLFGHSAGEWVAAQRRTEFAIGVGITCDDRESIEKSLESGNS